MCSGKGHLLAVSTEGTWGRATMAFWEHTTTRIDKALEVLSLPVKSGAGFGSQELLWLFCLACPTECCLAVTHLSCQQVGGMTSHVFGDQGGKVAHIDSAGCNHNETEQSSRKQCPPTGTSEPSAAVEGQASLRASACASVITGSAIAFSLTIFQRFIHKAIFHFSLIFSPFHIYLLTVSVLA